MIGTRVRFLRDAEMPLFLTSVEGFEFTPAQATENESAILFFFLF